MAGVVRRRRVTRPAEPTFSAQPEHPARERADEQTEPGATDHVEGQVGTTVDTGEGHDDRHDDGEWLPSARQRRSEHRAEANATAECPET